ncbi:MAG: hypothetical protein QXW97_01840 [Candidatus Pacearchaeota archaeon]
MVEQNINEQSSLNNLLTELSIRISELEERQRLLKDRILLIGKNIITTREELDKQNFDIKKNIKDIEFEIKGIKQLNERIISEIGNFARRSEIQILQRQFEIFQPLKFARIEDVKKIVREEFENLNKSNK